MSTWLCAGTRDRRPCDYRTQQDAEVTAMAHLCGAGKRITDLWCTTGARHAIAAEANARFPEEACGFVLTDGTVVKCKNVAEDPTQNFAISPEEATKWWTTGRVLALWHSHCFDPAVPSERDEELASPEVEHWIYSVLDEDLGVYKVDNKSKLRLQRMESN